MRAWSLLLAIPCACGGSSSTVKEEPAAETDRAALASRVEEKGPAPDWRLEASGAREDTMFRVDVVAYAPQARARSSWRESSQWTVEAEARGQPMKRLVYGPARVEETVDTGEVVVRFAVYFEPPTGKSLVDLKVAPPDGKTERTSLELEEAETWHKVETAGGPKAFSEGSFAAAGATLFAIDGKRLMRSGDGGKSWAPASAPAEAAQSIVGTPEGLLLATGGGLYESSDGAEWKKLVRPIPRRKLALAAGSRRLVAVADKRVVFCSADGKTWQRPKKGLPPGRVLDVAVAGKAVLVALTQRPGREGIYRSADGCKTFRAVGRGATVAAGEEVAVAAVGETAFRSDDDGATWHEVPAPGPAGSFHLAVVDGRPVAALLDANFPAALVRLDGASWQRVKRGGLPRVKTAPTLLPARDRLYLVADRTELWSLDAHLVR